jgi:FMN-dependent NADH-azoreductase
MHILNIQSSPRRSRSASIAVADAFLEAYSRIRQESFVDNLNVWEEKLPEFDEHSIGAKYKGINKEPMDEAEQKVWDRIQELVARFKRADRIVIGVPMWNFSFPYKLKQLIDLVAQRNMLFTYDGDKYGPLLRTPRALVVLTRGGAYAEGSPTPGSLFDHQRGFFEFWLRLIGVQEVSTLVVERTTWSSEEEGTNRIEHGKEAARKLALQF